MRNICVIMQAVVSWGSGSLPGSAPRPGHGDLERLCPRQGPGQHALVHGGTRGSGPFKNPPLDQAMVDGGGSDPLDLSKNWPWSTKAAQTPRSPGDQALASRGWSGPWVLWIHPDTRLPVSASGFMSPVGRDLICLQGPTRGTNNQGI